MKNKLNKHWPSIRLTMINWLIFAFLSLIVACFFLMRELEMERQKNATMKHNLELIEKQMGSGKVILELGEGMNK